MSLGMVHLVDVSFVERLLLIVLTYSAWKVLLIVDIVLAPLHQVLDVLWCWHLCWSLILV
jgi:hypothetical protein